MGDQERQQWPVLNANLKLKLKINTVKNIYGRNHRTMEKMIKDEEPARKAMDTEGKRVYGSKGDMLNNGSKVFHGGAET